jgi:15-cis-phytoene synthase
VPHGRAAAREPEAIVPDEAGTAYLLAEARRHDPDRYLCALLAPAERRHALLTLALLNHELARIPEIVSQPMAGMIRLQWWREALEEIISGRPARRHPVVAALSAVVEAGVVDPHALQALIDAREPALERIPADAVALEAYAAATGGALQAAAYAVLGGRSRTAAAGATAIGTAFALTRLSSSLGQEAARVGEPDAGSATLALVGTMHARVAELLGEGRTLANRPPRMHMAAFLPAALADSYLRQLRNRASGPLSRPPGAPLWLAARTLARRP